MKHLLASIVLFSFSLNLSAQDKNYKVKVSTVFGDMIIKLYDDTPNHRDNFVKNMLTVRAEKRLALAIKRAQALIYGQFTAAGA